MTGNGVVALVGELETLGARVVFGMPGTQNLEFFEGLRKSSLKTVLATSELAASFMAVGYGRATGEPGILATISGPGFTYALPGLAEALLDSVPLIHIVVQSPLPAGKRFRHQEIDHPGLAGSMAKAVFYADPAQGVRGVLEDAWAEATSGEPGPVVVWIGGEGESWKSVADSPRSEQARAAGGPDLLPLVQRLKAAKRPVLFLGLGAVGAAESVRGLAEALGSPVFTTPSARGVIPEDHPLSLAFDFDKGGLDVLNELISSSDLILALGNKFSHNGSGGFRLVLEKDRLVHVNSDKSALGANYPASLTLNERVEEVVPVLTEAFGAGEALGDEAGDFPGDDGDPDVGGWTREEIAEWRERIEASRSGHPPDLMVSGSALGSVREFLGILRAELPRDAIVVTDSGLHQVLVRRHFPVLSPRGLILPTDFQSMGFGLPGAIGAAFGAPERKVVAVIGDGGLTMAGMELLTLAREKLPVTVLVFNDGYLNLIRLQQERDFGHSHAVGITGPDLESFAGAMGLDFFRLDGDRAAQLRRALNSPGPALVELPLEDSPEIRTARKKAAAKAAVRSFVGDGTVERVKKFLGRSGS